MNNRAVLLSVVMAVIAVLFVQGYVSSIEDEAEKKFGTSVLVVVASKDIGEAETIDETMLKLNPIPKKFLDPSSVFFEASKDDPKVEKDLKTLVGTVALIPIKTGEQITYNKITEPGLRTGLSPQVTPGRRAFSIPVSETTGVGKLVKPGDRVDVVVVIDMGGGNQTRVAKTVLQDVIVLAVGRNVTNNIPRVVEKQFGSKTTKIRNLSDFDGFTSVTLEVDPGEAQMLSLMVANRNNLLNLVLRNNDDTERVPAATTSLKDVMGMDVLSNGVSSRPK